MKINEFEKYGPIGAIIAVVFFLLIDIGVETTLGDKSNIYKIVIDIFTFKHELNRWVACIYIILVISIYSFIIKPLIRNKFPKLFIILLKVEEYASTHLKPTKRKDLRKRKNK